MFGDAVFRSLPEGLVTAQLTDLGHHVLRHYRRLQAAAVRSSDGEDWRTLSSAVLDKPRSSQKR